MTVRQVSVQLIAQIGGYISPLKSAIQTTRDLRTELGTAAKAGQLDQLAGAATKMGLALTGGFAAAAMAAARFDKQMSEVAAVSGEAGAGLEALRQAALKAGADTAFSATEAAKAEAELAKAGLSTADILSGALTGSLDLAAAGSLDLSEAADTAAKAMNIFDLSGRDVGHVADVLAAAANKSATDVHELGMAMRMGGLAAKNAGVSLEETIGTLAAFADSALVGSDGGTSFKTMLQALAAPSSEATARMRQLGIEAYDAGGNFIGIAGLAGVLKDKLKGLTQEQRNEALATIFGADAMRAATVLYNEGSQGIAEYTAAVNDEGAAAEVAAKKLDNLAGDIEKLTGSLETMAITSGSGANSGLRILVQTANDLVNAFGSLPGPLQSTLVIIAGVGGATLLAVAALIRIKRAAAEMAAEMANAGPVTARMATGLQHTSRWAIRGALALGALKIAAAAIDAMTARTTDLDGLSNSLRHLGEENERAGELTRLFGDDLAGFGKDAALAGTGFNGVARAVEGVIPGLRQLSEALPGRSFGDAQERIAGVDEQLAAMVRNGNVDAARAAFVRLMQAGKLSADQMEALLPAYVNAMTEAERTTGAQAAAAKVAKEANVKLAGAFGEAASEADGLINKFDELNGKALSWREAERAAEEAVDDLNDALRESNGSLDAHHAKGRAAAAAIDEVAKKAAEASQAKFNETGSVVEANKVYQRYIGQLRRSMQQAGFTKRQIDALVRSIASMPATKTTVLNVITRNIQEYRTYRSGERSSTGRRWGGVTEHAQTGLLREADIYSPQSPARYAFAEPATRGEAFIPKSGDYGRSMGILQTAAGWYGAQVMPARQGWYGGRHGAATASPTQLIVSAGPNTDNRVMTALVSALRFEIRTKSQGSAQGYLGRGD